MDVNGDGLSDLCELQGVNGGTTSTGNLELHCVGGPGFGTTVVARATPYSYISTRVTVPLLADANGDGLSDLCLLTGVNGGTTASQRLEINCADAADNYHSSLVSGATAFGYLNTHYALPMFGDIDGDGPAELCVLTGVNGGAPAGSGSTFLECGTWSSQFETKTFRRSTPLPPVDTRYSVLMMGDITGDGLADLCIVNGWNGGPTASGASELSCLDGASGFQTWYLRDVSLDFPPNDGLDSRYSTPTLMFEDPDAGLSIEDQLCIQDFENSDAPSSHLRVNCYGKRSSEWSLNGSAFPSPRTDQIKVVRNTMEPEMGPVVHVSAPSSVASGTAFTVSVADAYDANDGGPVQFRWQLLDGTPAVIDDEFSESTRIEGVRGPATIRVALIATNHVGVSSTNPVTITVRAPK
jgi:hypothetical protein